MSSGLQAQGVGVTTPTAIEPGDATILVVEDTISNFILMVRMLSFMGVRHLEWKPTGWQVVPFANSLPACHLILMDIRMPYENGYHILKRVRGSSRLRDSIVCAVTAQASEEELQRAKKAGFDGFLGKPLDPDRFPDQIRRLLAREQVWERL